MNMLKHLLVVALSFALTTASPVPAAAKRNAKKASKRTKRSSVTAVVLYFDNRTGDEGFDGLSRGLADMLVTDLSGVKGLQIVERARLEDLLGELRLQRSKLFDTKTAVKLGKLIGATHAIAGAIQALKPTIRIDLRLIEVATGKVAMTSKVSGKATQFFDLEKQLAARFLKRLKLKQKKKGISGAPSLEALAAHGQALQLADAGDLKGASEKLTKLVAKHPKFKLAQGQYKAIMTRLYAAKQTRSEALIAADKALRARAAAETHNINVSVMKPAKASVYFAYRVLLGNLELLRLNEILEPKNARGFRLASQANKPEVLQRLKVYALNTEMFINELAAWQMQQKLPFHELRLSLTDQDRPKTDAIGLGSDAGDWSFANPATVGRSLAEFIFLGKPDHYGNINFQTAPSLGTLDPAWARRGWAHLGRALKYVDATIEKAERPAIGARVLDTWARCLIAMGRKVEAISRWQMILDRYPTHKDFKEYEGKIRQALAK